MALKGNTLTVDNRKSLLFLYSEGTINHKTWYVSSKKEIHVEFSSTTWLPLSWHSGVAESCECNFKASTHFNRPCLRQLTSFLVILATCLLMPLTSSTESDLCPQQYSHPLPLLPQRSTKQHLQGGSGIFPADVF